MNIREVKLPISKYPKKCPHYMTPQFIIIHNTYNDASAQNEIAYMQRNDKTTSFHYAVDDKEAIQGLPLNRNSWNAGDGARGKGNRYGISIEICYSKSGGDRYDKAEENGALLTAMLLKKYGWGIDKVKKHQDFSGKYCPHRILDRNGWNDFLLNVQIKLAELNGEMPKPEPIKPAPSFLPPKGYFCLGDKSPNIGKIAKFMYRVFPAYTSKKALGNQYGPYIKSAIKEFQKRTGLKPDGCIGKLTLAELKKNGFKEN